LHQDNIRKMTYLRMSKAYKYLDFIIHFVFLSILYTLIRVDRSLNILI
jgi:hypothetical protein